jgi:flagellar M-ring protein FliF
MPKADGTGFEIFDRPAFGMSDFVQKANYVRALQGELARTLQQIDGVESARVMIVLPENRLVIDAQRKATASVFLNVRMAGLLTQEAVSAIRFLVSNSVEGLQARDVTVVVNSSSARTSSGTSPRSCAPCSKPYWGLDRLWCVSRQRSPSTQ